MKKKKIAIVTGAAGFIGSHMVDLLISKGYRVKGLDNLSTGKIENLKEAKKNKNFTFKKLDICKLKENEIFFKNVDYIFHFAGIADLVPSIEKPLHYLLTNFIGTIKLLETSKYYKIKKFIYAASASCYGMTSKKVNEQDSINTEHPYAFSKYCGELAVRHWSKVYKIPFNSMRIFNAFGPRSRTSGAYGAVMGVFLKQKLEKKPFTVVGSGKQSRDFVNVKDVTNAFLLAAEKKISGEIFNIATSKPKTINLLTKIIGGSKIKIPNRPGEAFKSIGDNRKIKKKLKWKPKVNFKDGVVELLNSIDNWRSAPLWDKEKIKKVTKNWFKYLS